MSMSFPAARGESPVAPQAKDPLPARPDSHHGLLGSPEAPIEQATRVAVVGALSATTMLFASLSSAYLVRRSFSDWRGAPAVWPIVLLSLAVGASAAIEVAARRDGRTRRHGYLALAVFSALYLVGATAVLVAITQSKPGLSAPHNAFVVLLLGVHVVHAAVFGLFSVSVLSSEFADSVRDFGKKPHHRHPGESRDPGATKSAQDGAFSHGFLGSASDRSSDTVTSTVRTVTHFLTALLFAIFFLLFGLQ